MDRAGDERSPSPTTATSGTAARARDGDGAGCHGGNSVAAPAACDLDELRRRAAKERIRERILRQEAEALAELALETEVRRELMEELLRFKLVLSAPTEARAAPVGITANSPSPIGLETEPKANGSATSPAKRKSPDIAAISTVSAATSSKKQKPDLTCTVCGITTTSETAMQDHLEGKKHRKKVATLAPPMPMAEHEENEEDAVTNMIQNQNPDLTCTVCGITLNGEKPFREHLKGKAHLKKAALLAQPLPEAARHEIPQEFQQMQLEAGNPPAVVASEESLEGRHGGAPPDTIAAAGDDPEKVAVEINGVLHTVHRVDGGFLLCECCDVKATSERNMPSHLEGRKHINKAKVNVPAAAAAAAATPAKENANVAAVHVGAEGHTQDDDSIEGQAAGEGEVVEVAPSATPQRVVAYAGASVAPMEVDVNNNSATYGVAVALPEQVVKVQVEGKLCTTVLRQASGTLSCGLCGVHGCDKNGMLDHLYTRAHWVSAARLAEEKAGQVAAAAVNDANHGGAVTEGTVPVEG